MDITLNTGKEQLLHALAHMDDIECCMMLMTLWRCLHVRNKLVHHKLAPLLDVSCIFRQSYLDSLVGIKLNYNTHPCKGKMILSYDIADNLLQDSIFKSCT